MNKKLTLEDLKLESFLTEIDNSKLVKVQGGNGAYGAASEDGDCETGENAGCDTDGNSEYCPSLADPNCQSDVAGCQCPTDQDGCNQETEVCTKEEITAPGAC